MRKLIPFKEGMARLGMTIHVGRKWIRERRLPHFRMGSRIMLDEGDIERFIESNRVPSRDEENQ